VSGRAAAGYGAKPRFPGKRDTYRGFARYAFDVDGCCCLAVQPHSPRPDRAWVWKAEFFEAFPTFELAMLERGFHLAYITVGNTFGCPSALKHWDAFYREMTARYGLAPRPVLLGLSRGGLYIYNWAAANPDKVGCLYADNAVCDFKSWPGGKGEGKGSPNDWSKLRLDYGFASEAEALAYQGNPIDNLDALAHARIPAVHVVNEADDAVPPQENTDILERRYRARGGPIKVIRRPGLGHHPHGLEDPTPVIEYILNNAIGLAADPATAGQ
jgi:pimeloyl-ACP methyl ester carboxylesterase